MPPFILALLPKLLGFIKNPKIIIGVAIIGLLMAVFFTGVKHGSEKTNSKWLEKELRKEREMREAHDARVRLLIARYTKKLEDARRVEESLAEELASVRTVNDALSAEIADASLVKVELQSCLTEGGEIVEVPNPFNTEFVRLWNAAGRMSDGGGPGSD